MALHGGRRRHTQFCHLCPMSPFMLQTLSVLWRQAEKKWLMSGTPLQNSPEELYPYFAFLEYKPYDTPDAFKALMRKSTMSKRGMCGLKQLRSILAPIMLRRTKQSQIDGQPIVQLPGTCVTCPALVPCQHVLSPHSWNLYSILQLLASPCLFSKRSPYTHCWHA